MDDLIIIQSLVKHFPLQKGFLDRLFAKEKGFVRAVDGVSFTIKKGEVLGLVGESGCGKTTTGRLILRLLEPTSGDILYNGKSVFLFTKKEMEKMREKMQIVFQDPYASLSPRMSIGKAIEHPLVIHNSHDKAKRKETWDVEKTLKKEQENVFSLKSQLSRLDAEKEREEKTCHEN